MTQKKTSMLSPKMLRAKSRVKSRLPIQGLAADSADYIPILLKIRSYPKMWNYLSPKPKKHTKNPKEVRPSFTHCEFSSLGETHCAGPIRSFATHLQKGRKGLPSLFIGWCSFIFTHPTELWQFLVSWHVCVHTISCIYNIIYIYIYMYVHHKCNR